MLFSNIAAAAMAAAKYSLTINEIARYTLGAVVQATFSGIFIILQANCVGAAVAGLFGVFFFPERGVGFG